MNLNRFSGFQSQFHERWGDLNDPHVRALAWLLYAPDLLDSHAAQWHGRIATLADTLPLHIDGWLHTLDRQPEALHRHLDLQPFARLGRYAEKLMAFYLEHQGMLVAHGVQVRADKNKTIGEFDFLLNINRQFVHWEFATKFYLLESTGCGHDADYFVGPNLADMLGAKMRKIFDQQLMLSQHPAAAQYLPEPVVLAQALVKGWLFYHDNVQGDAQTAGTSHMHCRGFWCSLSEASEIDAELYAILPRLDWLAPARLPVEQTMNRQTLLARLDEYFAGDTMPVMVALLQAKDGAAIETSRGFVVPDDWRTRAGYRTKAIGR
jgi:hypothetical protein